MTPEERAKSVLHFLDEYLDLRDQRLNLQAEYQLASARQFLGTALVALVTEAKTDE